MAAIENLELQVTADISRALAKLEDLQEELQDVAEAIEAVDAQGADGIDVRTDVDSIDDDLARMQGRIEAFEAANKINIDTDVDRTGAPALPPPDYDFGANTRMAENVIPDEFAAMAQADPDFGGFNVGTGPGATGAFDNLGEQIAQAASAGAGVAGGLDMSRRSRITKKLTKNLSKMSERLRDGWQQLNNFNIRMSDIHNMLAALIPLLFVFIGSIPAVITAVLGLAAAAVTAAAALAAIAGFGAMGVALEGGQMDMENLTEVWDDIKESFIEAFAPLAEQLEPLFRDAVDGLGRFFQAIANQGDALMELTDEARAFGGFLMDFVPGALRTLAGLVEGLEPILSNIGQAINNNFSSFVRQLVYWTEQAVPVVADLVQTFISALPTIIQISIQFADVANEVLKVIGAFWRLITLNGLLSDEMGYLIAGLLVAATAFALLSKTVMQFALKSMWSAILSLNKFILGLWRANTAVTVFGSTTLGSAISGLIGFTASLISSIAGLLGFEISAWKAAIAAAAFWTAVTIGLALPLLGMISGMAAGFLGLSGSIDEATSSLKEFDRVAGRTEGGFNPYGGDPPSSGAGAATSGGGNTTINIESNGDANEDASNARYVSFRQGRTTGGGN